ncbi:MAG: putative DNA binding domain-containing protein [Clostridia bacterium]|nr:putative DNA binding domain-containing protein [Clostridia bacterium]
MRIIPENESLTIEFKSDVKKLSNSDIFDAVVAFANTAGGDLYLGVEDDGTITGVHPDHINPMTLSAFIANNTIPPVPIRAEIVDDVKPVLKISVPKSYGGIVATVSGKTLRRRLKMDGTPENVPMYPNEMATRLSDLRLLDYSALPIQSAATDDFDPIEVERLRKTILAYNGDRSLLELSDEELFKALGLVTEQLGKAFPTIAGILMLGREAALKQYVPTSSAAFQELSGTNVVKNEDFALPLLLMIEKLNGYLEARNHEHEIEYGLFRIPAPDFNKRALREAIVNAFSHRDYSKMGRVRVALSDGGLTIANPGGFIEGVSVNNLLTAEPHGRNPLLADVLKRIGLAERTGRGVDRIFEGSLIYGSPLPDYSDSTNVTVSLFIPRNAPDLQIAKIISDEQSRLGRPLPLNTLLVLNKLKDIPRSDIHQIAEAVNLSEAAVKVVLDRSIESGLVEAFGAGRGRTYMLSHKLYSNKGRASGYVRQADIDEARYPELIIRLAKNNEFISNADVAQLLHVLPAKAYRLLKRLVDEGKLEAVNKGRYSKYRIGK